MSSILPYRSRLKGLRCFNPVFFHPAGTRARTHSRFLSAATLRFYVHSNQNIGHFFIPRPRRRLHLGPRIFYRAAPQGTAASRSRTGTGERENPNRTLRTAPSIRLIGKQACLIRARIARCNLGHDTDYFGGRLKTPNRRRRR